MIVLPFYPNFIITRHLEPIYNISFAIKSFALVKKDFSEENHEKINEHREEAKKSGSRIVFSCGFDSIPFDLGVLFVQNEAIKRFGKPSSSVRGRVRVMRGEFSGGTAASMKATMRTSLLIIITTHHY